ncbi:MAG: YhjD/YihY/BrkB family envelope integrity protein [Geodermatophilaceae bacterium]
MSTDVEHENGRNAANQDPPGADAERPSEIPRQGWFQVVKRAFAEGKKDNVSMLAAGLAYFAFLALFPALIAAVLIYGLVADPADVQEQIDSLSGALPPEAKSLISDQMSSIASSSGVRSESASPSRSWARCGASPVESTTSSTR